MIVSARLRVPQVVTHPRFLLVLGLLELEDFSFIGELSGSGKIRSWDGGFIRISVGGVLVITSVCSSGGCRAYLNVVGLRVAIWWS